MCLSCITLSDCPAGLDSRKYRCNCMQSSNESSVLVVGSDSCNSIACNMYYDTLATVSPKQSH
eukprot:6044685-Amphidinium_carterae.1